MREGFVRTGYLVGVFIILFASAQAQYSSSRESQAPSSSFSWPQNYRGAVSLTFDDARSSQLDYGIPILDRHGVKATFYVSPARLSQRLEDWKRVAAGGHTIGNHTLNHPCSGNFPFARDKALENHSLESMSRELDEANSTIQKLLNLSPRTFAYPCGQKFVGRGEGVKSYVPLVAQRFVSGRGWLDENSNDPAFCDLAQLMAMELDGLTFEEARTLMDAAAERGTWLIFGGHDIGPEPKRQSVLTDTLEKICRYALADTSGIWIESMDRIAQYIVDQREQKPQEK